MDEIKELYKTYQNKIILPVDFMFENNAILDLGKESIDKYITYLKESKTIFTKHPLRNLFISATGKENISLSLSQLRL